MHLVIDNLKRTVKRFRFGDSLPLVFNSQSRARTRTSCSFHFHSHFRPTYWLSPLFTISRFSFPLRNVALLGAQLKQVLIFFF
ncbi:hypothetical protein V6N13_062404 [Hibiscus sabdariffa]